MANETYWTFLGEIIDLWSQYQGAKRLYINATHEETYFKVAKVVSRYYGGKVAKIQQAEDAMSKKLDAKLERFRRYCGKLGVQPITRDWLYHNVTDGKAAAKYRRKIKKNLDIDAAPAALESN